MSNRIFEEKCTEKDIKKISSLNNPFVEKIIAEYAELCGPKSIFVCSDSEEDASYIKEKAIETREEGRLSMQGHTIHFDSRFDQARDKSATGYLITREDPLAKYTNCVDKTSGLREITGFLDNSMKDKEMIVCFFSLGPVNSSFSIPALQITDSFYVAHSEIILYRRNYSQFQAQRPENFLKFIHSAGQLENQVSKNIDKRRVYIDLGKSTVWSVNTQYAGNTVGLKKLALRLAINRACKQGWLAEHMFIMGVESPGNRKNYFTGAFPSGCGKTSTAMLNRETIVGDDIALLKEKNGQVMAANTEKGMFGIIGDVNPKDDPLIWQALTRPGEVIFSNVLIDKNNSPRWLGDGRPEPEEGKNFCGQWSKDTKDKNGQSVPFAHKNARYTINLDALDNCDKNLNNPEGVKIDGIIYGGRDSDTCNPLQESFDWNHGVIIYGASLESEVTFATLDKEGVRKFNPFSNLDFVSVPIGEYIEAYLDFGKKLKNPPRIFSVNYFLKGKDHKFLTDKEDKHVWIKWMALRVNHEIQAIKTPIGFIPYYKDIKELFSLVLNKEYSKKQYMEQFSIRGQKYLEKIERIEKIYLDMENIPVQVFHILEEQKQRLNDLKQKHGDLVSPECF